MRRDPTEFRERFKAYKEGNKPYENGLPAYKNGTSNIIGLLDKGQLDTLHYIYDYYSNLGMGTLDIAGIAANMFKESSLRHNAKDSSGYHGYILMSPDMLLAVKKAYGNLNPDTLLQFVYDQVTGNSKVKGYTNGTGYKYGQYKTGGDAAEAFRATFERNKAGRQQSRIDYGNQFYDYFTKRAIEKKIGKQPEPIVVKQDATTVRRAIPEQQTIHTYDNLEASPYVTGKPMIKLLPPIKYPDLYLMMEDDQWEPEFQLPKLKNGKLPRYRGGKDGYRYVKNDETGGWDRITDGDEADTMSNVVVTPYGIRNKFDYESNPNYIAPRLKNEVVKPDNDLWTKQQVEKVNNTRTWRSDVADAMHKLQIAFDVAGAVYGGFEYAPVRNNIIKPLVKRAVRTIPTTDIERRGIEVLLRSTDGNGTGVSPKRLLELSKLYKDNTKSVFNYIFTGNGSKSFTRGLGNTDDYYTGFRRINDYSKPNAIFNDSEYGDIIDALLYKKKINPRYGVVLSEEPLFDFGLTPLLTKKYSSVQKYKVLPEENMYGFGETISPSEYKNIKNKHIVMAYDDFGKMTRPTSTSVPTNSRVGADLGHYDMLTGLLNGEPVYRWQDIYEFNPALYKASWDLSEPGESFVTSALKKVFLERLDKAHTPITIQRDWFTRPFNQASREFGFEIQ